MYEYIIYREPGPSSTDLVTNTGSTGAPGFPGRPLRHWQVFRQVYTATSTNRTDLDNAVGLLGRTQRQGRAL